MLEQRSLVKQHTFKGLHVDASRIGILVHLSCFAPCLLPGQSLKVRSRVPCCESSARPAHGGQRGLGLPDMPSVASLMVSSAMPTAPQAGTLLFDLGRCCRRSLAPKTGMWALLLLTTTHRPALCVHSWLQRQTAPCRQAPRGWLLGQAAWCLSVSKFCQHGQRHGSQTQLGWHR